MDETQTFSKDYESVLQEIDEHRGWFLGSGIVWIVLGSLAVIRPDIAGLATNGLIGALLVVAGIVTLIHASRSGRWRGVWLTRIGGAVDVIIGALLLLLPLAGIAALTLLLAVWLLFSGVARIVLAMRHRPENGWIWLFSGGILSTVLGALIALGWPATSAFAIGLIVGVHLIVAGWGMIMLALAARRKDRPLA